MQNNENYSGFDLTMYNLFTLLREMYYTRGETETNFLQKSGGVVSGSLTIQGNLVINGQSYTIDTENLKVGDYTITLAKDNEQTLTSMVGMVVPKYDGTNYGFFGWDADGYAYVGDLTNYDGTSAITLANNSSLQRISTIDTTNTVVASNGVIYVYDATSHCFKKPTNDNKYYVIRNGAFVETELFTEQKSKNIDNALYNLGAFDTISGNTITRQTGILLPSDLLKATWTRNANQTNTGYYFNANFNIPISSSIDADTIAPIKNNLGFTPIKRKSIYYGGAADNTIGMQYYDSNTVGINIKCDTYTTVDSFIANVVSKLEVVYQLATSYQEQVIENQPLLTLNQDGCNFLRNEWEKGLNLFDKNTITSGKGVNVSNGNLSTDASLVSSDYIEIKPNTTYSHNGVGKFSSGVGIAFYDSSKTYISGIGSTASNYNTFTTPSNATYLRFCVDVADSGYITDINTLMLNEGTHAYPYQEYNGDIVHKGDIEPVLLWENSSPTSAFSNGTIAVKDMSNFKYIVVEYKAGINSAGIYTTKVKRIIGTDVYISVATDGAVYRNMNFDSNTQISFSYGQPNGNNDFIIPLAIYGTNVL